ncbi:RHS repeat-associated core domain-containing protein [Luteibacter flocculans]|uniref:RHS repeat-associated core domain-containing protein n=2 Tax=Luteibacter flocculans TaxID=2780091 RepID=A0ABY4T3S6_9GAMM|nr:RHS repeat-associated core domain-containing protein [Luteibacter flocculans]
MKRPASNPTGTRRYGAYGVPAGSTSARTAYAGSVIERETDWHMLGERPYSPTCRRFFAPDPSSPFDRGGVNRYAYCSGDPINRVDPTGNVWEPWSRGPFRFNVSSHAPIRGRTAPTSPPLGATAVTPSATAIAATSTADVAGVAAAILPVAHPAAGPSSTPTLGPTVGASAAASSGAASTRRATPRITFIGQQPWLKRRAPGDMKPSEVVYVGELHMPATRMKMKKDQKSPGTRKSWIELQHPQNPASTTWVVDSVMNLLSLKKIFKHLSSQGVATANVYHGAHGDLAGRNWDRQTGTRLLQVPGDAAWGKEAQSRAADNYSIAVTPVDMGGLTFNDMEARLAGDGVHILGICYGLADPVVLKTFNLSVVAVFEREYARQSRLS